MNLCLLADGLSIHTQRWATALVRRGHRVTVLSLRRAEIAGVTVVNLAPPRWLGRLGYLATARRVRACVRQVKPDLLHAHYATSYGLLGTLAGYHPYMVSVWGSDVFDFPRSSHLHAALLRHNLSHADRIGSTSQRMKDETRLYTEKQIDVTPFGVDVTQFMPRTHTVAGRTPIVIGTLKPLEPKYGIPTLVKAFGLLAGRSSHVRLLLLSHGRQRRLIEDMVQRSSLDSHVQLLPAVPHSQVPAVLREMDIFVVPSVLDSESFCVAALEASACGLPVVASRVGGLPEVVIDGVTGTLVPPRDPHALAGALNQLIESEELRARWGQQGRAFVEHRYSWDHCVDVMEHIYATLTSQTER